LHTLTEQLKIDPRLRGQMADIATELKHARANC
jgi:hypothetical protein